MRHLIPLIRLAAMQEQKSSVHRYIFISKESISV